jgi:ribose/xylose/arabinose/galactoside ABC-type transport system permease subunit
VIAGGALPMSSAEGPADVRATRTGRARRAVRAAGVLTIVLALFVVGALVSPDFLSATNLVNAMRAVALLGIVATGVAFVTYSGHYADLSVPVVMAASGTAAVAALPAGLAAGTLAGLGTAAALGVVNGYVVGYLRANPIVWTLVTASVLDGVLRWLYSGQQVYPDATHVAGQRFLALYGASIGPVPLVLVLSGLVIAAGHLLLSRTRFGAELALVGVPPRRRG